MTVKFLKTEDKETLEITKNENTWLMREKKCIQMTLDFSPETMDFR